MYVQILVQQVRKCQCLSGCHTNCDRVRVWCVGPITKQQRVLCQALSTTRGDCTLCHEYSFWTCSCFLAFGPLHFTFSFTPGGLCIFIPVYSNCIQFYPIFSSKALTFYSCYRHTSLQYVNLPSKPPKFKLDKFLPLASSLTKINPKTPEFEPYLHQERTVHMFLFLDACRCFVPVGHCSGWNNRPTSSNHLKRPFL